MKKALSWVLIIAVMLVASAIGRGLGKEGMEAIMAKNSAPKVPFPESSPLYIPYKGFMEKLSDSPEFAAYIKKAKNKEEAVQLGFALSQQGISKLDDVSLERRIITLSLLLENMPTNLCAAMVRGDASNIQLLNKAIMSSLAELEPKYIDGWFDMSFNAIIAQLRNYPAPVISDMAVQASMANLLKRLPVSEQNLLVEVLPDLPHKSDADVCGAGKLVYKTVPYLPKPDRAILARALASS